MSRYGAATLAQVEAVLPSAAYGGLRPVEVHRLVGQWSLITVRHALRELVAAGRAQAVGPEGQRLYSLPAKKASP